MFLAGAVITLLFEIGVLSSNSLTHTMLLTTPAGPEQYAGAKRTVAKLWLLLGAISLAIALLEIRVATRRWLRPFVNPFTLAIVLGFAGGFLVSHPTFIWRGEHQLRSIQFYSDWIDPNLASLTPLHSWWNVTSYYAAAALPERWLQVLFLAGFFLILWRRRSWPLAFLIGAVICFVAHPVTMKLWPHHIIPWLPFLSYVAAYPVGFLATEMTDRWRRPAVTTAIFLGVLASYTVLLGPRLGKADEYMEISQARTDQISQMDHWLAQNVPNDAYLLLSYYALDSDGMFKWIEDSGVTVPAFVKRHRNVQIWWLARSQLDGRTGYVCVSRADIAFFRDDFERQNPESTYNPFEDENFEELATFGDGFYELKVFKYDFRSEPRT
jgi:hypothetical protein